MAGTYAKYSGFGGSSGGIASINADTTPAQTIVGGTNISVSTAAGTTTITNTATPGANTALSNLTNPTAINQALLFSPDNTLTIGAAGATRPSTAFLGTSLISPLVRGGSASAGNLQLSSTSNATKGSVYIADGSDFFFGSASAFSNLAGEGPVIFAVDNTIANATNDFAFGFYYAGTSFPPSIDIAGTRGTFASSINWTFGQITGQLQFLVPNGAGGVVDGRQSAAIACVATENQVTGSHGARLDLYTCMNGTDSAVVNASLNGFGDLNVVGSIAHGYQRVIGTTGGSSTINDHVSSFILDPSGTIATYSITMPASPADGMELSVSSSQIVTALTMSANTGQTLDGALSTFAANGFSRFIYIQATTTWYRIG